MERRNAKNDFPNTNTFEYSFPICDDAEDENLDSNKSTPYYTPLEYCTTTFEFPSPKPIEKNTTLLATTTGKQEISERTPTTPTATLTNQEQMNFVRQVSQSSIKQAPTSTSPAVSRKLRRFSLYERRSLSPQHLLTKNSAGSVDLVANKPPSPVNDKENAMPAQFLEQRFDENLQVAPKSGNNSPIILKDESSSPKILTADGVSRHNFSPKLLASLNSLKLANSPLGVISSAGYKNGNYFKFPEIDNVVQEQAESGQETISPKCDNQMRNISKHCSGLVIGTLLKSNEENATIKGKTNDDSETFNENVRKNRKNKNNLTIQISDTIVSTEAIATAETTTTTSHSPSAAKPKTPTIKNTKEKALSLDSAAITESGLSIVIQTGENEPTHLSCDEIDSKAHFPTGTNSGGQQRQRNQPAINRERLRPSMSVAAATTSKQSICTTATSPAVYRSGHKPSPLLHASNTNLKTLPEFLTLVEFSNTSPKERDPYAYKQKSMDLPYTVNTSTATPATTPVARTKIAASPSGSLLQRRGSNHSLTLNLHGSCSNLVGSCRTGLSVSNYSLGSVANSTTNLNIKSNVTQAGLRQAPEAATATLQPTSLHASSSQGVKQSLFRRRSSNQSLSLKNSTTTSCGNLNSFTSQNSLHTDRAYMQLPGVTRTTSFITPTQNTTSSAYTPKRGLLERRGSNQSLTLNMSSSFGGIGGADRHVIANDEPSIQGTTDEKSDVTKSLLPPCCAQHHRKFFSSENLNKSNTQFSELSENHHVTNRPFGSASDLKVSISPSKHTAANQRGSGGGGLSIDIDDSGNNVCTCSGIRNIMTRPLSPQRKAEEFKTYLANIQTLQNATNTLNQHDLIKLNYIFDNSYAKNNSKSLQEGLPIVLSIDPASSSSSKEVETPTSTSSASGVLTITSEDFEVTSRYEAAVKIALDSLIIDDDQQKRIFRELYKEFWDLPFNYQEKPLVFGSQTKNRYKNILPNETTRFMLQNESLQLIKSNFKTLEATDNATIDTNEKISSNGAGTQLLIASTETPYINANYIKGPDLTSYSYVATQGPLPNTIFDFWLMVFQNIQNQKPESAEYALLKDGGKTQHLQYYQKIIMLTNFLDHHQPKCAIYFPIELNEVFIAASKQEVVPNSEHLKAFFEEYLQSTEITTACGEDAIEEFHIKELNEEVRTAIPQAGNMFVIKNVGIVRKNGFSIRKMIGVYCLIKPQTNGNGNDENTIELLIKRFCCFHYWYPDWPDHRSPRDINTLLDISLHILNLGKCEAEFEPPSSLSSSPPSNIVAQHIELYQHDLFNAVQPFPIIHCSAGIGRTGCLTAILNGIRQMRQSLAYSLTSMAADIVKKSNANLINKPLSPIDFRLPTEFFDTLPTDDLQLECTNDTDSSFTRNTLLYIRFIAQKLKETKEIEAENEETKELHHLISLTDLPRMPDIIVDILGIVCNLRLSRGGMVQNTEQYELVHRALCLYLKRTFALKRF